MKAKFVYEAMSDVLKGKSEEEITSLIKRRSNINLNNELIKSSYDGRISVVELLLKCGADVHADNDEALKWASFYSYLNIIKLLLKYGADIHANDDEALQVASRNGHYDVVKLLLDVGANVHARILKIAQMNSHTNIVELLKKYM
ncbi:MAG: ankyrin repeat domain-containing protein [Nitrosopumilus sp.]